jgi:predicted 3-demethylubiquinone-9 3-methyltransferase (glyoxalase superfamily)
MSKLFNIVNLNYFSLYIKDFEKAVEFYISVFGEADSIPEDVKLHGWKMGGTWLTIFPSKIGVDPENNPRNAEFAIQVSIPEEVDALYAKLIETGATPG